MIHDEARLSAFHEAFARLPEASLGGVALDIGCGTGILGMCLLRQRPELSRVVAFEADPILARVAEENAVNNNLAHKLSVRAVRSTAASSLGDLGDAGGKVDKGQAPRAGLLVAEILDAGLLGEDCLPTLRHAARYLLAPGYLAVPASAHVCACGLESSTLRSWQSVEGSWWAPEAFILDAGDANPHDVVLGKMVNAGEARILTEEFSALSFNFESLPPESGRCKVMTVEVTRAGWLDAIVFWWYCYMARDDPLPTMTNAPTGVPLVMRADAMSGKRPEIGHWRQAVSLLPGPRRFVELGQQLRVAAFHTDEDLWFRLAEPCFVPRPMPLPRASTSLAGLPSARLWALADRARWRELNKAISAAAQMLQPRPQAEHAGILVLDLSDGPFMSLLLAGHLAQSFASSGARQGPKSRPLRRLLRMAGRKPTILSLESCADGMHLSVELLKFSQERLWRPCYCRIRPVLGGPGLAPGSVSMLCGEPYAQESEGLPCDAHFWQHWAQVDALRWTLAPGAVLLPMAFRVQAVLVSCLGLWKRRQPVTQAVHGIDVSAINELHPDLATGLRRKRRHHRFPCSLWQVEHQVVSQPVTLCNVSFAKDFPRRLLRFPDVTLQANKDATVHCLATWTEVPGRSGQWLPTAQLQEIGGAQRLRPTPALQGVVLARRPRSRASSQGLEVTVSPYFKAADGTLHLEPTCEGGEHF